MTQVCSAPVRDPFFALQLQRERERAGWSGTPAPSAAAARAALRAVDVLLGELEAATVSAVRRREDLVRTIRDLEEVARD